MIQKNFCFLLSFLCQVLSAAEQQEVILYDEKADGQILVNKFPPIGELTHHTNHAHRKLNPSKHLKPCNEFGPGKFAVYGECSMYLECLSEAGTNKFRRRIVECTAGQWFRNESQTCEDTKSNVCYFGYQISNPVDVGESISSCANTTTKLEVRTLPGCTGYYTCRKSSQGIERFTYSCGKHHLWNGNICLPVQQVKCPIQGTICSRDCKAGDVRTCSYKFTIEEFATMSKYCKNCPINHSDCEAVGCIPGGGIRRSVITINRMTPGPEIHVCKGDKIEVEVENRLASQNVAVHWHGQHMVGTPFMDGVPHLTQCPINPGNSFMYRFTANVSGTHMYHSHSGNQETDGLHGVLIVREPRVSEPTSVRYDHDLQEHVLLIWHWFARDADSQAISHRLLNAPVDGYGILVNGKGSIVKYRDTFGKSFYTQSAVFNVKSGSRYRFRTIYNAPIDCPIQLSIDGHLLDILALDGRPIKPMDLVDSVLMSSGERIDFVPQARPTIKTHGNVYYIRIRGLNECDDNNRDGIQQVAVLLYDNSTKVPQGFTSYSHSYRYGSIFNTPRNLPTAPGATPITGIPLSVAKDALSTNPRYIGVPDKVFYIDIRYKSFSDMEQVIFSYPLMNNITYVHPSFPVLTQPNLISPETFCYPENPQRCVNDHCKCSHTIEVKKGDLVELVMFDVDGFEIGHPFHMHGYAFKVIAVAPLDGLIYPERMKAMNEGGQITKRFDGPLKDTILVPGRGYAVLRVIADNPGYWFFHCHITEHMAQGMAMLIKVGQHHEMTKPPPNFPTCGNFS